MDDHLAMELAAQQLSLITYAQARRAGWTRHQIQGRLDDGVLVRMHRGVYRFASSGTSPLQSTLAACLAAGPPAAASHRRGAAVHGIWAVPDDLVEWRRVEPERSAPVGRFGFGRRPTATDRGSWKVPERTLAPALHLEVGDRVNHDKYGLGTVVASDGAGVRATVTIDFGSAGTVRLMLIGGVPMQKL